MSRHQICGAPDQAWAVYIPLTISLDHNAMCSCRNGSESGFGYPGISSEFPGLMSPEGCGFESHRALEFVFFDGFSFYFSRL